MNEELERERQAAEEAERQRREALEAQRAQLRRLEEERRAAEEASKARAEAEEAAEAARRFQELQVGAWVVLSGKAPLAAGQLSVGGASRQTPTEVCAHGTATSMASLLRGHATPHHRPWPCTLCPCTAALVSAQAGT